MVKSLAIFLIPSLLIGTVVCEVEEERVVCTYFIPRSDNAYDTYVEFIWFTPQGTRYRAKVFQVPPYCGSVYDSIFLPQKGKWKVVAREMEQNSSSYTYFEVTESEEEFFDE